MKIKVIMLVFMLMVLSGCTTNEKLIENYEKLIDDIQSQNYFDDSKFSISGVGCLGEDLLCMLFPDDSFGIIYVPDIQYENAAGERERTTEYEYLFLTSMGANKDVFDNISVTGIYLQNYIYNDYIFDENQGNYLIDFFQMLDENGIHYYIHKNTDIEESYLFYEDEDKEWLLENQSVYCDVNKYRTDKKINNYLGNQNLEQLDLLKYLEFLNCNTQLRISFDPENLKEKEVTLAEIEELSKKYYNPNHLTLDIREIDYNSYGANRVSYMDSQVIYSITSPGSTSLSPNRRTYNW